MGSNCAVKLNSAFLDSGHHQDFRNVPVIQHGVRREIFRDFAKTGFETRFPARAADAGFRIANDSACAIDHARRDERLNRQIGRRWIAAGIRNEPRARDPVPAEFRQTIDGFGKQLRRRMFFFVPARVVGGLAQAERTAQVDHFARRRPACQAQAPWIRPPAWRGIPARVLPLSPLRVCKGSARAAQPLAVAGGRQNPRDVPAGPIRRWDAVRANGPAPLRYSHEIRRCRREWALSNYSLD